MGAFLATLVAATVLSPTSRDSVNPFASAATQALVERAMARQRAQDSAVTDYTASLRYRLTVSVGRRRWGRSAPAAVEEQEARVTWAAPNNLLVDIVGRRAAVEQPGAQPQEHLGPAVVRGARPFRLDPPLQRRFSRDRPAASARVGRAAMVPVRTRRQPAGDPPRRPARHAAGRGRRAGTGGAVARGGEALARCRERGDGALFLPLCRHLAMGGPRGRDEEGFVELATGQPAGEPAAHARRRPGVFPAGRPLLDAVPAGAVGPCQHPIRR